MAQEELVDVGPSFQGDQSPSEVEEIELQMEKTKSDIEGYIITIQAFIDKLCEDLELAKQKNIPSGENIPQTNNEEELKKLRIQNAQLLRIINENNDRLTAIKGNLLNLKNCEKENIIPAPVTESEGITGESVEASVEASGESGRKSEFLNIPLGGIHGHKGIPKSKIPMYGKLASEAAQARLAQQAQPEELRQTKSSPLLGGNKRRKTKKRKTKRKKLKKKRSTKK